MATSGLFKRRSLTSSYSVGKQGAISSSVFCVSSLRHASSAWFACSDGRGASPGTAQDASYNAAAAAALSQASQLATKLSPQALMLSQRGSHSKGL